MKTTFFSVLALAGTLALPATAVADPWKDESGHGYRGGPPPWAPAHGARHKHEKHHEHREERREPAAEVRVSTNSNSVVIQNGKCNREAAGAVLGGIVGGVLGNQVGRHNGNTELGTVAGAIIGVVVGTNIGRDMDNRDASCAAHALDHAPDGQSVTWRNPESGLDFRLTPTDTFRRDGQLCRRYRTEAVRGKDAAKGKSEACRMPDGKWHFNEPTKI